MTVDQIPANRSNRVTAIYRDSLCKYLYYIHIYSPPTLRDLALPRFVREGKSFSRTCSRVRIAVNRGRADQTVYFTKTASGRSEWKTKTASTQIALDGLETLAVYCLT